MLCKARFFLILVLAGTVALLFCTRPGWADYNPFASVVIDISLNPGNPDYLPAPGQWINTQDDGRVFNDANKALGPPVGGGTNAPNDTSVVSLGGFGGQIVLAFDHDVEDSPANPMGLDAIVFSNANWVSADANLHWAEPATIEIMPELNANTIPGDDPNEKWYLIAGSDLTDGSSYRSRHWIRGGDTQPPNTYPAPLDWPNEYDTAGYELFWTYETAPDGTVGIVVNPNCKDSNTTNDGREGYWGYAEYTPTLLIGDRDGDNDNEGVGDVNSISDELFYTNPDDPMVVGITPGSGGGDAFDINWAVDGNTWQPANLTSFRYIRITNAVEFYCGALGEVSAEIDAVADVRPVGDVDCDDDVDFADVGLFTRSWLAEWGEQNFNPASDWVVDNKVNFADYARLAWGWGRYNSTADE